MRRGLKRPLDYDQHGGKESTLSEQLAPRSKDESDDTPKPNYTSKPSLIKPATSKPSLIKPAVKARRKMVIGTMTDHLRPKPRIPIIRNKVEGTTEPSTVQPKKRKKWAATMKKGKAKQQKVTKGKGEVPFSLQRGKITEFMRYKSAMAVNEKPEFLMPPPRPRKRKSPMYECEEPEDEEDQKKIEVALKRDADEAQKNKEIALKEDTEEAQKNKDIALKELEQMRLKTTDFMSAIKKLSADYSQHQLAKANLKIRIQRLDDQLTGQEQVAVKYKPSWYIRDKLLHLQNTNDEGAVTFHGMNLTGTGVPDWLNNMLSHLNNNATGSACIRQHTVTGQKSIVTHRDAPKHVHSMFL